MQLFSKYIFSFSLVFPFLFCIFSDNKTATTGSSVFPVPQKTEDLLFYLQRTINSNTVIYELNKDKTGEINFKDPIKIQWIRFAKDSAFEPLNYIQKTFAYGLETKLIDTEKKSFVIHFVSYKGKPLYLLKSEYDNKYHVYTYIHNKLSMLDKVYVQIDGGTFWVPEIRYVEITGTAPVTAEKLSEQIKP